MRKLIPILVYKHGRDDRVLGLTTTHLSIHSLLKFVQKENFVQNIFRNNSLAGALWRDCVCSSDQTWNGNP